LGTWPQAASATASPTAAVAYPSSRPSTPTNAASTANTAKTAPTRLDRKQYSLKIIDLRNKYANISNLIRFVSELYENTKASSKFFENLLRAFGVEKEGYPKITEEIEGLTKRAKDMHCREVEVIAILDNLMESLIS
jgi:hypothetical protein